MFPEVADEAYPGEEASPTGRAEVGGRKVYTSDQSPGCPCVVS